MKMKEGRNKQKEIDWIRVKLEKAEKSGFTAQTEIQILKKSKALLKKK